MSPLTSIFVLTFALICGCATKDQEANWYTTDDRGDLLTLDPDTAAPSSDSEIEDCGEVTTKINTTMADETPDPKVGDEWFVRMYCDGVVTVGTTRLFFQPAEVARVDPDNTIAEFVSAGESLMTMQSGNLVYTKTIIVTADE